MFFVKSFLIRIFAESMCLRQCLPTLDVEGYARYALMELCDFLLYLDLEGTRRVIHVRNTLELWLSICIVRLQLLGFLMVYLEVFLTSHPVLVILRHF